MMNDEKRYINVPRNFVGSDDVRIPISQELLTYRSGTPRIDAIEDRVSALELLLTKTQDQLKTALALMNDVLNLQDIDTP